MAIKKFTAIVFFTGDHPPHKYRGITNKLNFEAYCMRKLDAWYVNYYDKETKEFVNRKYFKNFSNGQ